MTSRYFAQGGILVYLYQGISIYGKNSNVLIYSYRNEDITTYCAQIKEKFIGR